MRGVGSVHEIRLTVMVVGTAVSRWLGGFDGLLEALVIFMFVDYATGIFCAIAERKLSSAVGFRGILRKVLVLMLVGVANAMDTYLIEGDDQLLRTAVIFFYLSNEGISILENATRLGLPIPNRLRSFLAQIKSKGD